MQSEIMAVRVKRGLKELKTMQSFMPRALGWHFATFCLPSQSALLNEGAAMTPLAAQPLMGDLQRRWEPRLRFTLTFDMQTQGSVPLKLREPISAPLRPLSHLSSHLQIARRLVLEGSLAVIYFSPWIPQVEGLELWRTSSCSEPLSPSLATLVCTL